MSQFVYTGQENLEAMKEARNYNDFLISLVTREARQLNATRPQLKILDFGAGIGTYADMLREKGYQVDCLELDDKQVAILRDNNYTVFTDISEIKEKYDIIYAFNVFEHIETDKEVYAQLCTTLRDDGVTVIYVPAMQIAFSAMDSLVGHHRRYDLGRLRSMATQANVVTTRLEYLDPLGLIAALVYKVAGNKQGTITSASVRLYDRLAFPFSNFISPLFKRLGGKNALLVAKKVKNG